MNTITKSDINEYVVSGTFHTSGDMKPELGSTDKKRINFNVEFNNVPVSGIVEKALSPVKIAWVNNNRKNFTKLTNGQTVTIQFTAPSVTFVDPVEQLKIDATAAGVDINDDASLMNYIISRMK